mmetsp:Transcript_2602/g.5427  ORF Transcript_2602/g.5427 Transcript_2602/m.5427 type:complete len:228 (-) Transcript_2602:704-1387(-)
MLRLTLRRTTQTRKGARRRAQGTFLLIVMLFLLSRQRGTTGTHNHLVGTGSIVLGQVLLRQDEGTRGIGTIHNGKGTTRRRLALFGRLRAVKLVLGFVEQSDHPSGDGVTIASCWPVNIFHRLDAVGKIGIILGVFLFDAGGEEFDATQNVLGLLSFVVRHLLQIAKKHFDARGRGFFLLVVGANFLVVVVAYTFQDLSFGGQSHRVGNIAGVVQKHEIGQDVSQSS